VRGTYTKNKEIPANSGKSFASAAPQFFISSCSKGENLQPAKRVRSLQREDFTSGTVEEFIYFGNSSNIHFYLHFIQNKFFNFLSARFRVF